MTLYIDKNSYEALKENIFDGAETNSKWDPYFINESNVLAVPFLEKEAREMKQVQIFKKNKNGPDKPILNERNLPHVDVITKDKEKIPVTDEQMIKVLNIYLNINFTKENEKPINDLKDWLLEKKGERTEESKESKPNSEIVEEGDKYKYETKNGEIKEGVISNTKGVDGESVNNVNLKEKISQGGKRKSKKSKKTKKSKKSKTRKNSRKTNRRR